jgi:hypothetical protein
MQRNPIAKRRGPTTAFGRKDSPPPFPGRDGPDSVFLSKIVAHSVLA